MGEKGGGAVGDHDDEGAAGGGLDGIHYCSEHPYRPGAGGSNAAAAAGAGGICALCLQEKLGRLVSSSKSSPFFPLGGHPPPSSSSSSPPSFRSSSDPPPLHPSNSSSRKFPFLGSTASHKKGSSSRTTTSSSSSSTAPTSLIHGVSASSSGLKRSKSVAPRPVGPIVDGTEEFSSASSVTMDSPRKKSFWSFLYLSSSSSSSTHRTTTASVSNGSTARRKSVSVTSSAWTTSRGAQDQLHVVGSSTSDRRLEVIGEPDSPSQSQGSSSSFGRKVARSRSVGCGSRSFSGDFLERISNGFGDCTLRRVESQREPKPKINLDADDNDDDYEQQHRIKCAGFFGGLGATSSASSSYWLSAAAAAEGANGTRMSGARNHRSWGWAFASPMRALRPTTSTTTKTITAPPSNHVVRKNISSPMPSSEAAAATN